MGFYPNFFWKGRRGGKEFSALNYRQSIFFHLGECLLDVGVDIALVDVDAGDEDDEVEPRQVLGPLAPVHSDTSAMQLQNILKIT